MSDPEPAADEVSSPPVTDTAAPATIDRDLPCHRCGYNLRTLPAGGVCPECEAPVRASLDFHEHYGIADGPAMRIRRGLAIILVVVAFAVALATVLGASGVVLSPAAMTVVQGLMTAFLVAITIGVWLSTGTTGRRRGQSRLGTAARWLFVLLLVQSVASEWLTPTTLATPRRGEWLAWLWYWYFTVGTQLIPGLAILSYGLCLAGVAAVTPRVWLARALACAAIAFGGGLLIEPLVFAAYFATAAGTMRPWMMHVLNVTGPARLIGAVAFVVLIAVLYLRLRKR